MRRIYTDLAIIDVTPAGFVARAIRDGHTAEALQAKTGAPLEIAPDCATLTAPDL